MATVRGGSGSRPRWSRLSVVALVVASLAVVSLPAGQAGAVSDYVALNTALRLVDTRPGATTSDGQDAGIGLRAAGSTLEVQVAGRAGVPADASTAVLTVTAVNPLASAFLTVHPTGTARPNASNVNYSQGENTANTVLARIGAGGKVSIYTFAATHLVVDVSGHLPASVYTPLSAPQRLADTRDGASTIDGQQAGGGPVPSDSTMQLRVAGRAGVPADASTAVVTIAAVGPADDGFLTAHPTGTSRPNASNLNYHQGQNRANTVLARIGAGGDICLFTQSSIEVIVDVAGYLTGPPPPSAGPTCPPPGEPSPFVTPGRVAEVPGVPFNETFELRILPGDFQPVAASLPPLTQLVLTDEARMFENFEVWVKVTAPGATGWISMWDLVYLGGPRDLTADAIAAFGGVPTAATMLDLGDMVTAALVPSDPAAPPTRIVLVSAPTVGSPSESVYDTFPGEFFGDDTTIGSRYRVTGSSASGGSSGWVLDSVVAEALCTRGVDPSTGFCI